MIDCRPQNVSELVRQGNKLLRCGQLEEAATLIETARKIEPENPVILEKLISLYLKLKRAGDAEREAMSLISVEPLRPLGHFYLASSLKRRHRRVEALEHAKRAAELDPGNKRFSDYVSELSERPKSSRVKPVEIPSDESRARDLAASIGRRNRIKNPNSDTVRINGERLAQVLATEIEKVFGSNPETAILDFGAAAGRVSIPLARLLPRSRVTATDVDAEAVEFLRLTAPENIKSQLNGFSPPLSWEADSFDCVFAISVWSHFADHLSMKWLEELRRITRPGALLLISTQGNACFQHLRGTKSSWAKLTREQYLTDRYFYRDYPGASTEDVNWPGITQAASWGITVMHPDYIKEKWGALFEVLEIREQGTGGKQDLVIMRRLG